MNNGYSNKEVNDLIVKQAGEKDESRSWRHPPGRFRSSRPDLSTHPALLVPRSPSPAFIVKGVTLDASLPLPLYASVTKG